MNALGYDCSVNGQNGIKSGRREARSLVWFVVVEENIFALVIGCSVCVCVWIGVEYCVCVNNVAVVTI